MDRSVPDISDYLAKGFSQLAPFMCPPTTKSTPTRAEASGFVLNTSQVFPSSFLRSAGKGLLNSDESGMCCTFILFKP